MERCLDDELEGWMGPRRGGRVRTERLIKRGGHHACLHPIPSACLKRGGQLRRLGDA